MLLWRSRGGITPKRLELLDEALPDGVTDNVKVLVRTRPVNEREIELGAHMNIHIAASDSQRLG